MSPRRLPPIEERDEAGKAVLFKTVAEVAKIVGVVVSIVISLGGALKFATLFIDKQDQLIESDKKQEERLKKLEELQSTQAVDKFRLNETEKKISDALVAVTEMSKNVMEMRIQLERLNAKYDQKK